MGGNPSIIENDLQGQIQTTVNLAYNGRVGTGEIYPLYAKSGICEIDPRK